MTVSKMLQSSSLLAQIKPWTNTQDIKAKTPEHHSDVSLFLLTKLEKRLFRVGNEIFPIAMVKGVQWT